MPEFKIFNDAINKQLDTMCTTNLFVTDIPRDVLWNTYLDSYPPGTNEIFRERREYDCQCCKNFIKNAANIVTIKDMQMISIWDIKVPEPFQTVANAMSKLVKSQLIKDEFLYFQKNIGTKFNIQTIDELKDIRWEHFHYELPKKYVKKQDDIASTLSRSRSNKEVLKASLDTITLEAAETVLELIEQKSLYRGEEHKSIVQVFIGLKSILYDKYAEELRDKFCWIKSLELGTSAKIKNTVIGTLLVDISTGTPLDDAVKMFESKVAPTNYKRPTAVITKSMIANAQKKFIELGYEGAEQRRYAVMDDITINNVLFANRSVKKIMNVFDEMSSETTDKVKNFDKVEEVNINDFIIDILPKSTSVELMFENKHQGNLVSLIAPSNKASKNMLKWDNNFCWSYKGEVADSMKERVKKAGGNVEGILRFSIQWNDDGKSNQNDLDAHCIEPNGNLIHYPKQKQVQRSSGVLDVDVVYPYSSVAVENITWSNIDKMGEGIYKFIVHNFSERGGIGWSAEIEYNGVIHSFNYIKKMSRSEKVTVAIIDFNKETGIKFIESLPSTAASKEVWGVSTEQFRPVEMIMNSPNYWDDNHTGNKHYFFMLQGCKNPDKTRGFYNEFLNENLRDHRKVFETLGSKMKVDTSEEQLAGLGFSSTLKNSVLCKVTGSFTRLLKINF